MDIPTTTILSNIDGLRGAAAEGARYTFVDMVHDWPGFIRQCANAKLIIIDNDERKLFLACVLRPFLRFRLVSVDLILRPPRAFRGLITRTLKRALLSQVDRFLLYFKNTSGYHRYYGISPSKTDYVPFKVNGLDEGYWPQDFIEGEYVLCAGRTLRDVDTFVAAMRITGCPGILLQQDEKQLRAHGSAPYKGALPPNVQLVLDQNDGLLAVLKMVDFLAKARIVVIPRFRGDIGCTGISTYLMAMGLGKCVILSRGPGAEDLLTDQAFLVEPENSTELAQAISELWNNDVKRRRIAAAGSKYAQSCGASHRLLKDILTRSLLVLESPQHRASLK
jgi:glycosyltransferase involved in cell wall biosynthesis